MKTVNAFISSLFIAGACYCQPVPADSSKILQGIKVTARKPLIRMNAGKITIQPDAAASNAGTTVLELLEKLPGVMVDKDGNISLKGKAGVLVMIDDKPTYLSGTELAGLLGSMSSLQLEQIELIPNPPAKYDASGNAGIINIRTKRNREKGFKGTISLSPGLGRYFKTNNSISLNYRNGKISSYLNYSMNRNKGFTDIYALRSNYNGNGTLVSLLDQPTYFVSTSFNNTVRAGADYYISSKTTAGIALTGVMLTRKGSGDANATWLNGSGTVDSSVVTNSASKYLFKNGGINLNLRHDISKEQKFSVDIDGLVYNIHNKQFFGNRLLSPGGYHDTSKGELPSHIHIITAKADHTLNLGSAGELGSGFKTSYINTDNLAAYQINDGNNWKDDPGKSNHFLYRENIYAFYSNYGYKYKKAEISAGLRFEQTHYNARQTGYQQSKDSSFSRNYSSLFPSAGITCQLDSSGSLSLTIGRRIDRPAFQSLNPFIYVINKYTYQQGNPFFKPQYAWNTDLSYQYKQLLTITASYSVIKDYFSQIFITRGDGILVYSEGNVGRMYNLGLSATLQFSPVRWWSLTGQATANHKKFNGYVWNDFRSSVTQLNININNQLKVGGILTAELSGYYTTRARNDLQELLSPTGQVSLGLSAPVLKKKGSIKASIRDVFYTQFMEGVTQFESASEYFILKRDTRVVTLAFVYNLGGSLKTTRRNGGGAEDEMQRAGT